MSTPEHGERRAHPRRSPSPQSWLATARVRPGHEVTVINLSSGGALVEAAVRLLPGARVTLQFVGPGVGLRAAARVIWCRVAALDAERGVRYRGALAFDRTLEVFAQDPSAGYRLPEGNGEKASGRGHVLPTPA